MINTVLFDLDGTLLGMDNNEFENKYFSLLGIKFGELCSPEDLYKNIWESTIHMVKNSDGVRFNQEIFFERFNALIKEEHRDFFLNGFNSFYDSEFDLVKDVTYRIDNMINAVSRLKCKGYDVIVATNPLFPKVAIDKRILWAGFLPDDFSYATNFEICRFCKPNPKFYEDILKIKGKKPKECLMVGNDMLEDMVAKKAGINTYLVTDCVIKRDSPYAPDYSSDSSEFLKYVDALPLAFSR
ncbi:HAD family hydrolase [Lutispora sp.]|nr:HAD family hydrolase [Lutispora sp.]MEA4960461.1 HAD family hydrolase [Lutispora sp.]